MGTGVGHYTARAGTALGADMHGEHKPLTLRELWQQLADELFSLERGLPYTIVQLFRAPGATVRRYVVERDPRVTRPVRYFALPGTLFAALILALRPRLDRLDGAVRDARDAAVADFAYEHMLLLAVVGVVATALAVWLVFRSRRPTLVEEAVLATYANAQGLWLNGLLIVAVAFGAPKLVALTGAVAMVAYGLWITADYFGGRWRDWLLALLSVAVGQAIIGVPVLVASMLLA